MQNAQGGHVIKSGRRSTIGSSTATPRAGRGPVEPPTPSGESGRGVGPVAELPPSKPNRIWLWVLGVVLIALLLVANTGILINLLATGSDKDRAGSGSPASNDQPQDSAQALDVQDLLAKINTLSPADRNELEQLLGWSSGHTGPGNPTGSGTSSGDGGGPSPTPQPLNSFPSSHLTATIDPYPPSDARGLTTVDPDSQVWVAAIEGGGFLIQYHLTGLPDEETRGGFSLFTGDSCSALDGTGARGFTHSPVTTALWHKEAGKTWVRASEEVRLPGVHLEQIAKHAFVVREASGLRIGCGILRFQHEHFAVSHLTAVFNPYPASDERGQASLGAGSQVWLTGEADGSFQVHYYLTGLPTNEDMGGIHVHAGTACGAHDEVLGHYYTTAEDPWTTVWRKNLASSVAFGSTSVANPGFALADAADHAFVVHEQSGKRIACGTLQWVPVTVARLQEVQSQLQAEAEALLQARITPDNARRSS